MPLMDGYEVIQSLKNKPDPMDIPIIILTGIENSGEKIKELSTEVADYFTKTEGFGRLFEAIERIVNHNVKKEDVGPLH